MTRHSLRQQVKEARQIAADHHLLIVEKAGKFQIYRCMDMRNVFIGERSTPGALCAFVRKATNFS